MKEQFKTTVHGHVQISDRATGEILVDKSNAIHPKNMATAIARGLANSAHYQIYKMKLGNRGTYIDGSQQIQFQTPNVTSDTADLYNATYVEVVDDGDPLVGTGNSVTFTNIPASTSTRVIVTCVISANEAFTNASDTNSGGQIADGSGSGSNTGSQYFFDELGLFTQGSASVEPALIDAGELLLSHLIFSPIEHTGNRELVIVYTLTISVS
jgi:hypothetical protein